MESEKPKKDTKDKKAAKTDKETKNGKVNQCIEESCQYQSAGDGEDLGVQCESTHQENENGEIKAY